MLKFLYAGLDQKKCEEFYIIAIENIRRWSGVKSITDILNSDKVRVECMSFASNNCLPLKQCDYLVLDNDFGTLYGDRERKAIEKVESMKRNIRPSAKVINKKQFLTMLKEICEAGI